MGWKDIGEAMECMKNEIVWIFGVIRSTQEKAWDVLCMIRSVYFLLWHSLNQWKDLMSNPRSTAP